MTFNIKTLALVLALSGMFLPQVPVARAADAVWGSVPWACNTSQTVDYGCDMTAPTLMQSFNLGQSITITGWQSYNTVVQSLSDRCAVAFMIVSLAGDHTNDVGVSVTDTVYSLGIQTNIVPTWQHTATDGYFRVCSVNGTFTMPPVASLPAGIQAAIASGQQMYAGFYPIYYTNGPFVGGYNVGAVYKPIRIIDPNQAPTAYIDSSTPAYSPTGSYATGNRTLSVTRGTSVTLNGHGTDADGTIGVYEWRQGGTTCSSGGRVYSSQNLSTSTTNTVPGTYRFYYSVLDNKGARPVNCPSIEVTITAPTPSLVVCQPTASVNKGVTTQLDAWYRANGATITCSSLLGTDIKVNAAPTTWSSTNTGIASVNAGLVNGVQPGGPVTITATYGGKSATAAITVTNNAPIAFISSSNPANSRGSEYSDNLGSTLSVSKGATVTLGGRGTDADGTVASYVWRLGTVASGLTCASGGFTYPTQNHSTTTNALGTYRYYYSVVDDSSVRSGNCPYIDITVSAAVCTGADFVNATLCSGASTGLPSDTQKTLAATCDGTKCQYQCNSGYDYASSVCTAHNYCGSAVSGVYTTAPSKDLCETALISSDTPSIVGGQWEWHCYGAITSTCHASKKSNTRR